MRIDEIQPTLKGIVRLYAGSSEETAELEREARIEALRVYGAHPDALLEHYRKAISNRIVEYLQEKYKGNKPAEDDKNRNLVLEELKERFGYFYITKLKESKDCKDIVRGVIIDAIEQEGIEAKDVPFKADYDFFVRNGLGNLLWAFYRNSPFMAVSDAYPNCFLRWEFNRVPDGFWKGNDGYAHALEAMRWFAGKKKLRTESDCRKICSDDFEECGLGGMLQQVFNYSPFLALQTQFEKLKPWHVTLPKGFLDSRGNCIDALDSYILENGRPLIHGLNREETYELGLRQFVSQKSLQKFGLCGLVARYRRSPNRLFREFYPEQMLPWTLAQSKDVWKVEPRKTAGKAVRWLFEDYLHIPLESIPRYASNELFWKVGFSGILTNRTIGFNSSTFLAVDNAYPKMFMPSDFGRKKRRIVQTKDLRKKYRRGA